MTISESYRILEVPPGADSAQIRKAYLRLAKIWHPDVNNQAGAKRKFQDIQLAYQTLKKAQKKGIHFDQSGTAVENKVETKAEKIRKQREKMRQYQEELRVKKQEELARKHALDYVIILQSKSPWIYKSVYILYLVLSLCLLCLVLYVSISGFFLFGIPHIFILFGVGVFIMLPVYYIYIFLKEFAFLYTSGKPKIKFYS